MKLTMLQSCLSRAALLFLSSSLAVLSVACSEEKQVTETGSQQHTVPMGNLAAIQPPVKRVLSPKSQVRQLEAPTTTEISPFESALDKAHGAKSISQSAQSPDDWDLVASQYQDAIALMKQVRQDSPNFAFAQRKIMDYRRQIIYAQQQAKANNLASSVPQPQSIVINVPRPATKSLSSDKWSTAKSGESLSLPNNSEIVATTKLNPRDDVFITPIKRRIGGTPIIEVTFNGKQRFEMIVDTGASGTVITQEVATALGVVPVGVAKANTASSKAVEFPIGYLDSMEAGGMMKNKIPVAIAGAELETGLLGHDFFGNYDVTIKRNVVEFRPQTTSEFNAVETELTPPTLSRGYRFVKFP
jgi:predicted aspartyl protease